MVMFQWGKIPMTCRWYMPLGSLEKKQFEGWKLVSWWPLKPLITVNLYTPKWANNLKKTWFLTKKSIQNRLETTMGKKKQGNLYWIYWLYKYVFYIIQMDQHIVAIPWHRPFWAPDCPSLATVPSNIPSLAGYSGKDQFETRSEHEHLCDSSRWRILKPMEGLFICIILNQITIYYVYINTISNWSRVI